MKKKGFTLVELLAVIAILAILVIIALPNVLRMFRNAKQNTFASEVQNLVRSAENKYLTDSMNNTTNLCFDSKNNKLDMSGRDNLIYKIRLSDTGKLIEVNVKDSEYEIIASSATGINREELGKTYKVSESKTQILDCNGNTLSEGEDVVVEPSGPMLKKAEQDSTYFLVETLDKSLIENIKFENTKIAPDNVLGNIDVSDDSSGEIMMWWTDTDDNDLYEVTIGSEGGVKANTDSSYLFSFMTNLNSINFTNFDTSKVEKMMVMFQADKKLETITFGENFDTSHVTTLHGMFDQCVLLTELDLSSFDTSNVTSMAYLFSFCLKLKKIIFGENFDTSNVKSMYRMFYSCSDFVTLDLSHFNTSNVTNMQSMFTNCSKLTTLNLSSFDIKENTVLKNMFDNTDLLVEEPYVKFNELYSDRFQ